MPKPQLKEILNNAANLLAENGIVSARIDARILLENVFGFSREELIAKSDYLPSNAQTDSFNAFIKRRMAREPVAKIIGKKEFWGLDFKTSKYTLDPRPDSETLIEAVLENYPDKNTDLKILDFGTGTGCLLLALLNEYEKANGIGVDISEDALKIALENAKSLGLNNRAEFILSDWDKEISGQFDVIISNPPYIKSEEIITLEKEVCEHDPMLALDGGNSGLEAYRKIIPAAKKLLKKEGMIFLEIGQGQENDVQIILQDNGFSNITTRNDLAGITRCVSAVNL